jgi:hypothetical protein
MVPKVMKFVKGNLVPLICGLAVLLGLIAWLVWPLPGWKEDLQGSMSERYGQVAAANQLISNITIPGGVTLTKATYEKNVIEAATHAQKNMAEQAKTIVEKAAEQNRAGRVKIVNHKSIPYLGTLPEDNYLPTIDRTAGEPYGFKVDYEHRFEIWMNKLVGKDNTPGIPPAQADIQAQLTAEHARAAAPIQGSAMFAGAAAAAAGGANDPAELARYTKAALARHASEIKMYVDLNPFTKRSWYGSSTPPTEPQIFEALIDCWFQDDVVNAILETNKGSTNVGTSPVKRLEKILVGVSPSSPTSLGQMFFANPPAAAGAPPAAPTAVDLTKDMTGRVSNSQYDVVLMNITVDLDPAYENAFIAALYRQNNGYTVLNVTTKAIDPFDAAGNGYLYGNTQVVHLDLLVEGLLFRSWTLPIMPDATKTALGIPLTPATPPAPPAGAPGAPPV